MRGFIYIIFMYKMKIKLALLSIILPLLAHSQAYINICMPNEVITPIKPYKQRLSSAYIGLSLNNEQLGISLVNSIHVYRQLFVGAGVDITELDTRYNVPVYADIRLIFRINKMGVMGIGQFGKPLYNEPKTGMRGKLFSGYGIGIIYRRINKGAYLSYIKRHYEFTNSYRGYDVINVGFIF